MQERDDRIKARKAKAAAEKKAKQQAADNAAAAGEPAGSTNASAAP